METVKGVNLKKYFSFFALQIEIIKFRFTSSGKVFYFCIMLIMNEIKCRKCRRPFYDVTLRLGMATIVPTEHLTVLEIYCDVFVSYKGLQNDHKALMKEIEEALHKLHARDKEKHRQDEAGAHEETMEQESQILLAFAKVDTVSPGSPASMSVSI